MVMIGKVLENLTDKGVEATRRQEPEWDHYANLQQTLIIKTNGDRNDDEVQWK